VTRLAGVALVTDTYFAIHDFDAFVGDRRAHEAVQEWVRKHGIDPNEVAAHGPVHRDVDHCRVVYVGRDRASEARLTEPHPQIWTTLYQQGETPPMPWPVELDRYREGPATDTPAPLFDPPGGRP
jgi:hypothetical protein